MGIIDALVAAVVLSTGILSLVTFVRSARMDRSKTLRTTLEDCEKRISELEERLDRREQELKSCQERVFDLLSENRELRLRDYK